MTLLRCPACGRRFMSEPGTTHRPFCSERCRLIDLGAWITEKHRIAGEPTGDHAERADFGNEEDDGGMSAAKH